MSSKTLLKNSGAYCSFAVKICCLNSSSTLYASLKNGNLADNSVTPNLSRYNTLVLKLAGTKATGSPCLPFNKSIFKPTCFLTGKNA